MIGCRLMFEDNYHLLKLHRVAKDSLQTTDCIPEINLTISLGIERPQLFGQVTGNLLHCPIWYYGKKKDQINTAMRKFDFPFFPFFRSISFGNQVVKRLHGVNR